MRPLLAMLLLGAYAATLAGDADRFRTTREGARPLELPEERDRFTFAVFGDRTGGPAEGIAILDQAVDEVNLLGPDLVMTVGDLIQGYSETPTWMRDMREYRGIMDRLTMPWFPVAGNHDTYWRGAKEAPPANTTATTKSTSARCGTRSAIGTAGSSCCTPTRATPRPARRASTSRPGSG